MEKTTGMARMFENNPWQSKYWAAFQMGILRRQYGSEFVKDEEHDSLISKSLVECSLEADCQGYFDGFYGPVDWAAPKNAIPLLRKWRNWSEQDLADKIGVSTHTIREWEQGKRYLDSHSRELLEMLHIS